MIVGKKAAELLQEVAWIEPENLPPYNVRCSSHHGTMRIVAPRTG